MTNKGSDNRPETGLLLKSWRSSDLTCSGDTFYTMMTRISLCAFAVRLVARATRAQEQGKLSGR